MLLHGFLNSVGLNPALVRRLVDLEAVAHQAGGEVGGDALAHQSECVGVAQVVGLDAHLGPVQGVVEHLAQGLGALFGAREISEPVALDPRARAGGYAPRACFGGVGDLDPVVLEPGECGALVEAEAVGGAHAEGPAPVRQGDPAQCSFDGLVGGDVALGELVDPVAPAGGEQGFAV